MAENKYFEYLTGMKDGEAYAHRASVQSWEVNYLKKPFTIIVQGPLPDGQYNAFAKKHLMTTTGGAHDGSPEGKLTSISVKRRNDIIAFSRQDRQDKLDWMTENAPKNAAKYNAQDAFGANGIGNNTPLTMIHCDAVTPAKLKEAFAQAIDAITSRQWEPQRGQQVAHTNVRFKDAIIYNQLYNANKITKTTGMAVMVMRDRAINTYHVFHGAPFNPAYPNAG